MKKDKEILKGLKPERVWFYFCEIMQIPRPSKHEERISAYLVGWGKEHGLETLGFSASLPPRVAGSLENNRWYDVKVVLKGDTVTASLDGREIFSAVHVTELAQKDFFQVCGFDEEKGELVVKCVNISDEARPLTIDFGTALKPGEARRIELSGAIKVAGEHKIAVSIYRDIKAFLTIEVGDEKSFAAADKKAADEAAAVEEQASEAVQEEVAAE